MLCSIALIVYVFPRESQFGYEYQKNTPWLHEDLIAPFDFSIRKTSDEVEAEKAGIEESTPAYFIKESTISEKALAEAKADFDRQWSDFYADAYSNEKEVPEITSIQDEQELRSYSLNQLKKALSQIYKKGILENSQQIRQEENSIILIEDKVENEFEVTRFHSLQSAYEQANTLLQSIENEKTEAFVESIILNHLEPNILLNEATRSKILENKLSAISASYGKVSKGEKIIERGEIVSEEIYKKLQSLELSYEEQTGGSLNQNSILFGQVLLVSIALIVVFFFLSIFRKDVIIATKKLVFIFFIFTMNAYLASIPQVFDFVHIYALPFALLPIAIRTFFDNRLAAFVHVISMILVGFFAPNPFEFVFIQTMTGLIALFSLTGLRKSSQLLFSSLIIFFALSITYLGFSTMQEGDFTSINIQYLGYFALSGGLTLFIYPLIFLLEKSFGFLSDVTLMELSDTNSPLLRALATKAPGTFQHSMQVANLSEEAALTVGADPLLIRTGALYHDIGKMKQPTYFIENQMGTTNPHNDLQNEESAKIIINHVIYGIQMAKKANLPEPIIDFIRTHHGKTVTRFFYNTQLKVDPETNKEDYQYPGPLPFSKETAILMMADSVEAAARSLKEYNADTIGNLVNGIIDAQAKEDQFTNADITFKDLSTLKKLFKKRLMSIYHVRVEYPK